MCLDCGFDPQPQSGSVWEATDQCASLTSMFEGRPQKHCANKSSHRRDHEWYDSIDTGANL